MKTLKICLMTLAVAVVMTSCSVPPCSPSIPYPEPGNCGTGAPAGEPGGVCPGWPAQCTGGTECIAGVCNPCGGSNEGCCGIHNECNPGLTCDQKSDYHPVCSGACGQLNQVCCTHSVCGEGLVCENQACVTATTSSTCQGSTQYWVGAIDKTTRCALEPIPVMADDPAQATTCAQGVVEQLGKKDVIELTPPTTYPNTGTEYQVCKTSSADPAGSTLYFTAFSDADAQVCGHQDCFNDDTCNIVLGACPSN